MTLKTGEKKAMITSTNMNLVVILEEMTSHPHSCQMLLSTNYSKTT
jgi:hypothetical protein